MDQSPSINPVPSLSKPQNKLVAIGIILVLLLLALWLVSRQGLSPFIQPPGQPSSESTTDIPVPVYPQATFISSKEGAPGEWLIYQGVWETDATVPQVIDWYMTKLQEAGWTIDVVPADLNDPQVQFLAVVKQDRLINLSVIHQSDQELTQVTVDLMFPEVEDEEGEEE